MAIKPNLMTDLQWMHRISGNLERFQETSSYGNVYKARCPICGDSESNPYKARLYFYDTHGSLNVDCKNCGYSHSFYRFMSDAFPHMFQEYKREVIKESLGADRGFKTPKPVQPSPKPKKTAHKPAKRVLDGCIPLNRVPEDHPARVYMRTRGFTEHETRHLMFADDFKTCAESVSYKPLSEDFPTESRIVIPFYDVDGNVLMIQGRSLDPKSKMKYITIKTDPAIPKIYGMERIDPSKTIYCVEGPLDSLFVDNCIASCDSSLTRLDCADVYIWDNEPRAKDIIKLMNKAIEDGHNVVIWPNSPDAKQDINDMILSGMTREQIMRTINENTFQGGKAKIRFTQWKKR